MKNVRLLYCLKIALYVILFPICILTSGIFLYYVGTRAVELFSDPPQGSATKVAQVTEPDKNLAHKPDPLFEKEIRPPKGKAILKKIKKFKIEKLDKEIGTPECKAIIKKIEKFKNEKRACQDDSDCIRITDPTRACFDSINKKYELDIQPIIREFNLTCHTRVVAMCICTRPKCDHNRCQSSPCEERK